MVAARPLDFPTNYPIKMAPDITPEVIADLDAGRHPLQAGQPQSEPDRSVWRILSIALITESEVSDEQLHAALPTFSLATIAGARARVSGGLFVSTHVGPQTLAELAASCDIVRILAEPSITSEEAKACGLL